MTTESFKRRLTAILSADVEGYSRLMREDEESTIHTLTAYRGAITNLTQRYRGRVVDTPGDNILADFTSVVDAVNCAVEPSHRKYSIIYSDSFAFAFFMRILSPKQSYHSKEISLTMPLLPISDRSLRQAVFCQNVSPVFPVLPALSDVNISLGFAAPY